jgi:hypothetical protein
MCRPYLYIVGHRHSSDNVLMEIYQTKKLSENKYFICYSFVNVSLSKHRINQESLFLQITNLQVALFTLDNSTRILSTIQIYEIGQYGPITLIFNKLPRKFSLVKTAIENFQMFPPGYFIFNF